MHSSQQYSKKERQTFEMQVTVPAQSASLAQPCTPAWATDVCHPPKTKPGRPAHQRKTLGWITATATAAVRAKDNAIRATVSAATAQAPEDNHVSAIAAGRVVLAAAHVEINTHYQAGSGSTLPDRLRRDQPAPPSCWLFVPLSLKQSCCSLKRPSNLNVT